jgi:hypothetical protein
MDWIPVFRFRVNQTLSSRCRQEGQPARLGESLILFDDSAANWLQANQTHPQTQESRLLAASWWSF